MCITTTHFIISSLFCVDMNHTVSRKSMFLSCHKYQNSIALDNKSNDTTQFSFYRNLLDVVAVKVILPYKLTDGEKVHNVI